MRNDHIKDLLNHGSEIAGAAVGGAVGFFAAGPAGAAGAGILGVAAAKLLLDISNRTLSRREEVRVGATAAFAIDLIRQRLEAGEKPRTDDFFKECSTGTSVAEEIFDGVLITAKNDHEEQKAFHYGRLFANVTFENNCSRQEANYLLHIMDNMTFLQMILLNIFSDTERFHLRTARYESGERVTFDILTILNATFALFQSGLLRMQLPSSAHGEIILEMNQLRPAYINLTVPAFRLFRMAGLQEISRNEIDKVSRSLSPPGVEMV